MDKLPVVSHSSSDYDDDAEFPRLWLPSNFLSGAAIEDSYEIQEKIGAGGFGTVFRAVSKISGARRAVKRLPKRSKCKASHLRKRIISEIDIMRTLAHNEAIVSIIDCYEDHKYIYIVTELCHGVDVLQWRLVQENMSEHVAVLLFKDMLSSLCRCHEQCVLHNDIKPDNFFMTSSSMKRLFDDRPNRIGKEPLLQLGDFGLACLISNTPTDIGPGTAMYTAPEVLKGGKRSIKSDMWSLGVTFYCLLTGDFPSDYEDNEMIPRYPESFLSFLSDITEVLNDCDVSKDVQDLVVHMLQFDPIQRASVDEAMAHPLLQEASLSERSTNLKLSKHGHVIGHGHVVGGLRPLETATVEKIVLDPGGVLFSKGDHGRDMYIVRSGNCVEAWDDGNLLGKIYPGGLVGEMAYSLDTLRNAEVRCAAPPPDASSESRCNLLRIPPYSLDSLKARQPLGMMLVNEVSDERGMARRTIDWLKTMSYFKDSPIEFLIDLSRRMSHDVVHVGETLMKEGDCGNNMCLLIDGSLDVYMKKGRKEQKVATLTPGSVVGEMALLVKNGRRKNTVIANSRSELLVLSRTDFDDVKELWPAERLRIEKMSAERRKNNAR